MNPPTDCGGSGGGGTTGKDKKQENEAMKEGDSSDTNTKFKDKKVSPVCYHFM